MPAASGDLEVPAVPLEVASVSEQSEGTGEQEGGFFAKSRFYEGNAVAYVREQRVGKGKGSDAQGAQQDDLILVATRIFFGVVGETQEEVTSAGSGVATR